MRGKSFIPYFVLSILLSASAIAEAAEESPAIIKLRTVDTDVSPDGLYTRTLHMEVLASNAAAAMEVGQQSVAFNETMEDLEVVEAYTAKTAGEKIPVGPNAIYTQQPQGSAQYPLFDDQRQKVIVFPSVAAGDTVVFTVRWRSKQARIPGQFTASSYFPKAVAYEEVRETITALKSFPLQVENHDVEFSKQDMGDRVVYRWHYSAPKPTLDDPPPVSPLDQMPRFHVSSFKDYDAFGQGFGAIFAAKEAVTPRIQMLADSLTNGMTDHRRQAQAIYEWVSKNIRYVAVDIGNGGIVPHEADSVLANAYGDCKDHAVLFSTLLKAKGIQSEAVLINLGNEYALAGVPTLVPMNHAITWLPEFKLYADTTAGTAPFGVLPFEEYGKPVIHAVAAGSARRTIPVLARDAASINLKVTASLDKDGKVAGTTAVTATGPFSITLRGTALAVQGTGAQRFAAAMLQRQGFVGTGDFTVPPPTDLDGAYTLQSSFTFGPKPEFVSGVRFDMVRGPWLLPFAGDFLMGPVFNEKLKDTDATACFSGHVVEEMTLQAPEGRQFRAMPEDVSLRNANLEFTAHWSVSKESITLRQEFLSKMNQPLCDGTIRRETSKMLGTIRRHYQFDLVSLVPPPNGVAIDAQALVNGGEKALNDRDWMSAIRLYSAAINRLGPQGNATLLATAYNGRGIAYRSETDLQRAIADFSQALRVVPDFYYALVNRGFTYAMQRRDSRAESDFNEAIQKNPKEAGAYDFRAMAFFDRALFSRADADCETSIKLAPRTSHCYSVRARIRYVMTQYDKAIADGTEAIRVEPNDPSPPYNRGLSYLASAQYAKAVSDFDSTLKLRPNFADALFARSVAKTKLGQDAAGDADRAAAAKIVPNIAYRMAGLGVSTSNFVPGVDDLAACKTSNTSDILQGVNYCTRTLGMPNLSNEDKTLTYSMLGDAYLRLSEWDEAIADFDKALQLNSGDVTALTGRGRGYASKGNQEKALEDLNAAVKLAPDNPFTLMFRGQVYGTNGENDLALADYNEVIRLEPNAVGGYFYRAVFYEQSDQFDKAISDLNTVIRIRATGFNYGERCFVLALADRLTAAMADCEKALVEQPNDANALGTRGLIYYKLGQESKAAEDFNRAVEVNPRAKLGYYGRGVLKLKNGDRSGEDDIAEATLLDADFVARMRRRGVKP